MPVAPSVGTQTILSDHQYAPSDPSVLAGIPAGSSAIAAPLRLPNDVALPGAGTRDFVNPLLAVRQAGNTVDPSATVVAPPINSPLNVSHPPSTAPLPVAVSVPPVSTRAPVANQAVATPLARSMAGSEITRTLGADINASMASGSILVPPEMSARLADSLYPRQDASMNQPLATTGSILAGVPVVRVPQTMQHDVPLTDTGACILPAQLGVPVGSSQAGPTDPSLSSAQFPLAQGGYADVGTNLGPRQTAIAQTPELTEGLSRPHPLHDRSDLERSYPQSYRCNCPRRRRFGRKSHRRDCPYNDGFQYMMQAPTAVPTNAVSALSAAAPSGIVLPARTNTIAIDPTPGAPLTTGGPYMDTGMLSAPYNDLAAPSLRSNIAPPALYANPGTAHTGMHPDAVRLLDPTNADLASQPDGSSLNRATADSEFDREVLAGARGQTARDDGRQTDRAEAMSGHKVGSDSSQTTAQISYPRAYGLGRTRGDRLLGLDNLNYPSDPRMGLNNDEMGNPAVMVATNRNLINTEKLRRARELEREVAFSQEPPAAAVAVPVTTTAVAVPTTTSAVPVPVATVPAAAAVQVVD